MRCLSGFAKLLRVNHARLWGALNIASSGRKEPTFPPASRIAPIIRRSSSSLEQTKSSLVFFFYLIGNTLADTDLMPIGFLSHPPTYNRDGRVMHKRSDFIILRICECAYGVKGKAYFCG